MKKPNYHVVSQHLAFFLHLIAYILRTARFLSVCFRVCFPFIVHFRMELFWSTTF